MCLHLLPFRMELPYPLNYLATENPGIAYMIVKTFDKMGFNRR